MRMAGRKYFARIGWDKKQRSAPPSTPPPLPLPQTGILLEQWFHREEVGEEVLGNVEVVCIEVIDKWKGYRTLKIP